MTRERFVLFQHVHSEERRPHEEIRCHEHNIVCAKSESRIDDHLTKVIRVPGAREETISDESLALLEHKKLVGIRDEVHVHADCEEEDCHGELNAICAALNGCICCWQTERETANDIRALGENRHQTSTPVERPQDEPTHEEVDFSADLILEALVRGYLVLHAPNEAIRTVHRRVYE